jgi:hypothetical protein
MMKNVLARGLTAASTFVFNDRFATCCPLQAALLAVSETR